LPASAELGMPAEAVRRALVRALEAVGYRVEERGGALRAYHPAAPGYADEYRIEDRGTSTVIRFEAEGLLGPLRETAYKVFRLLAAALEAGYVEGASGRSPVLLPAYRVGEAGERLVARILEVHGWRVKLSPGSRGAADIEAVKQGRRWLIQVKTTLKPLPRAPDGTVLLDRLPVTGRELGRLKTKAARNNATPVLALVYKDTVLLLSARTLRPLQP
jgi:Holliday junction resolvase